MSDFSIDAAQERITDARSRRYFGEVYSSYANGNYRSAVVMLWSVVVCDLLFKLDFLKNTYADATAQAVLTEIESLRAKNPKSPDWEWELVKKVKDRTHLLDAADVVNLQALQDHRHLSAHPVLTAAEALFSPSKEQCRAHIRNALDGVLTKPAIMSRKVLDSLLEDIEAKQALLPDDESLRRYLDAAYWRNLAPAVEQLIFRSLWQIVFRVTDSRCEANRDINYRTLRLFYARRPTEINTAIQQERAFYSQLTFSGSPLDRLMHFLSLHTAVFGLLTEAATTPIRSYATRSLDSFLNAWFLSGSVGEHLAAVRGRVEAGESINTGDAFQRMCAVARAEGQHLQACEIGITLYGRSREYDTADFRCQHFVLPSLADYDRDRMLMLLRAIEQEDQTYTRRRAARDHRHIKARADQLLDPNWLDNYPHFARSI
jgi:hypothetical protein